MATLRELTEKYKTYTYEELVGRAAEDYRILLPVFDNASKNHDGRFYVMIFMYGSLVSDGKLTGKEYEFSKDVLGLSKEEIDNVINRGKSESATDIADSIFDVCPDAIKAILLDFCLCFVAVDGEIDRKEIGFLARLLA